MSRTALFALNAFAAFLLVAAAWFAVNAPELARIGPGALALTAPAPAKPPLPPAPHTRVVAAPAEGGLRPLVFARSPSEPASLRPRRADAPPAARGLIAPPIAPLAATTPPAAPIATAGVEQSAAAALAPRAAVPAAQAAAVQSASDAPATPQTPPAEAEAVEPSAPDAEPAPPAEPTAAAVPEVAAAEAVTPPAFAPPAPLRRPEPPAEVAAQAESDDADEAQATAEGGAAAAPSAPSTAAVVAPPKRPVGDTPRSVAEAATSAPAPGFGPTEGMILLGVFKTRSGDRAMVRVEGKGVASVRLGDEVAGWRVARINETTVQLRRGGQSRMLELPEPAN